MAVDWSCCNIGGMLGSIAFARGRRHNRAPMQVEPHLSRARQLLRLDQVGPAIAVLRDLLARDPENPDARALLSRAFLAARDAKGAIEHAKAALARAPENHLAHIALAEAYISQGRMKAARPHVDFLVAASPDWPPYRRLKASVESGQWWWFGTKTLATLEESVALDPQDAASWSALADFQSQRDNTVAAERAARRALALDPEDRSSLYIMGMAALREHRFEEARDNALSILRRWPKDNKGLTLLASVKMGESRLLGIFFRVIAACMRLERTWVGKLSIFAMLGVYFVMIAWDADDDGLTPMRATGLTLMALFVFTVVPAYYLQGFLIHRELARAKRKAILREDY
jgi:tetratricopeptide (TPR) repeat protein